ncbi:MAG: DnaJ domain-containing protein [Cyanobacteriota bacterium]|nr:DnaJ domain-containing protein [Cyanobacteriota bacterium]
MSRASMVDYWQVLGLEPGADAARLKRAFREQARRWHPDLNGNDPVAEERFKRVNEAYAVLSDPRRRQAWEAGEEPWNGGEAAEADPFARGFPDFEAYLDELYGPAGDAPAPADDDDRPPAGDLPRDGARRPMEPQPAPGRVTPSPTPPPPVPAASSEETLVELTPEQAVAGDRVDIELHDGTLVEVWTPPLAGDGWRLRLPGLAPGGGDHFLHLRVRTADGLRVDGLRVLFTLELTPWEAALGCQKLVPTLQGDVRLRVPPGSSSGRLLRLRGRGLPLGEQRGDQIIELRILVPATLSEAEEALYRRLGELAASG